MSSISLFLIWGIHFLLPFDIDASNSWAFRLRLGLAPLAPLVLRPSGLVWNHIPGFPGPPACRWQNMGLLSLYDHMSQSFIIYLSIYLHHIGTVSLENFDLPKGLNFARSFGFLGNDVKLIIFSCMFLKKDPVN